MSRLFAILMSFLILIQGLNISMNDIMKLDELIEHAQFHKQEYGDNFITFLSKHYGEFKTEHLKTHQEEKQDHDELPFHCQGHVLTSMVFIMDKSNMSSLLLDVSEELTHQYFYQSSYSYLHDISILQPPRYA